MDNRSRALGVPAMAAAAFLWSIAGLFIKLIDWHPLTISGVRSLIAVLVILAWLKRPRLHWSFPQVAAALSYAATMILFVSANKLTTSSNAIILQYIGPIFTAIIGSWILKERARVEHWIAFLFVAGGMALMFMDKLGGGRLAGDLLAVLSALAFSFTFIFMRMQKASSSLESMLLAHALTAAVGLTASLFLPAPHLTTKALTSVAVLGIFQVGLAAVLFAYAIKRISAVTANLVAVIEPVFNPIWVFLVLGEAPGARSIAGGVVIIAAVTAASVINPFDSPG
ncbi:MAG: DMT family transporter [Candidatus Aminicenantes bacterium]|nr:DMT family transporter [Candidatus Aminicenantes bacterium]